MSIYEVVVGEDSISLKSRGSSKVVVIGVLGKECDDSGRVNRIYLDSLIHLDYEFEGWAATGAVSTFLTRC